MKYKNASIKPYAMLKARFDDTMSSESLVSRDVEEAIALTEFATGKELSEVDRVLHIESKVRKAKLRDAQALCIASFRTGKPVEQVLQEEKETAKDLGIQEE